MASQTILLEQDREKVDALREQLTVARELCDETEKKMEMIGKRNVVSSHCNEPSIVGGGWRGGGGV